MVPRRVTGIAALIGCIGAGLLACAFTTATAQALNTRVSITDFKWSNENPKIDLGESVTWDWIGPDTQHSVSGQDNASQWDSDPNSVRAHKLGDTFKVTFDQPGNYVFQCKLHTSVRGTVTVSNDPGSPNSDPGPAAPLNLDFEKPDFEILKLTRYTFGPKGKGTGLKFANNEWGTVSADFYKLVKHRWNGKTKTVRLFRGYQDFNSHIGFNLVRFANRTKNFRANPGSYVALLSATDESQNTTRSVEVPFDIKGKQKKAKP